MAHDLATPATVLESQLQAMVDGVVPADREQLDRARAAAGALSGVIVQLGELVDAESAVLQRRPQVVAVGELIGEVRRAIEPLFRERRVEVAVGEATGSLTVDVDPTQVGRALRNVLANAAQHSPQGATVRVAVEAAGERGGAAGQRRPAPGSRPRTCRMSSSASIAPTRPAARGEPRSGSGIGLTIARELSPPTAGRIAVERTGPDGTTFLIALPRVG